MGTSGRPKGTFLWNQNAQLALLIILRGQRLCNVKWFGGYGIGPILPFFALFGPKGAIPVVWRVYIISSTNRKVHLVGPMMGQRTFYGQWFSRYRIWLPVTLLTQIGPKKCVPLDEFWGSFQKWVIYDPINTKWAPRYFFIFLQIWAHFIG